MLTNIAKKTLGVVNAVLGWIGLKLIPRGRDLLFYQHDYREGYAAYRATQIRWNKAKLAKVWADAQTLEAIASDIDRRGLRKGICHGARNGFEVRWLAERLKTDVVGTDISETAAQFGLVVHDFHDRREDWIGKFGFIYTNSLDQAFDPEKALTAWLEQLTPNGCIYIEHTMLHSPVGASEMDPFGAHPLIMPYLIHKWGGRLNDIIELKTLGKGHVWVFVVQAAAPFTTAKPMTGASDNDPAVIFSTVMVKLPAATAVTADR